jgi:hypothetical protein
MQKPRHPLGYFFKIALLASLAFFSGCRSPLEKVSIAASATPITTATDLENYDEFASLVSAHGSFILTVTNKTCTCTTEFLPYYDQYLSENNIPGYTLEYALVLYENEKYGLPVVDSNSPILTIYDAGTIKYAYSYQTGDGNHNRVFTSYDVLSSYLGDRIDVSTD